MKKELSQIKTENESLKEENTELKNDNYNLFSEKDLLNDTLMSLSNENVKYKTKIFQLSCDHNDIKYKNKKYSQS